MSKEELKRAGLVGGCGRSVESMEFSALVVTGAIIGYVVIAALAITIRNWNWF